MPKNNTAAHFNFFSFNKFEFYGRLRHHRGNKMASNNVIVFSILVILTVLSLFHQIGPGVFVSTPIKFIVAIFGQGLILETYVTDVFSDTDIPIVLSCGLSFILMFIH